MTRPDHPHKPICLPCALASTLTTAPPRLGTGELASMHDLCLGRNPDFERHCECTCPWLLKGGTVTDNARTFADVSSNNGPGIDLNAYAAAGHRRLAAKVSEAINYVNPYYAGWHTKAHALALELWVYHFARPGISGGAQAGWFLQHADLHTGDTPVLDIEGGGWAPGEANRTMHDFCAVVGTRCGRPGVVYASPGFITEHGLTLPAGWSWWIAAWGPQQPGITPMAAWQFTETGSATGIGAGHVDLSLITAATPTPQGDDVQVPTLKLNDHGRQVYALQTILRGYQEHLGLPRSAHCPVPITGTFDTNTKGALQDVQKTWPDLTDFGVCTPHVWWMLTGQYGPDPKGN